MEAPTPLTKADEPKINKSVHTHPLYICGILLSALAISEVVVYVGAIQVLVHLTGSHTTPFALDIQAGTSGERVRVATMEHG